MGLNGADPARHAVFQTHTDTAQMSFLDLSGLVKSYGTNHVVKRFDLGVTKGECVSLLGPSGCGKTTVLRMVAGFEVPSAGMTTIDGQDRKSVV